MSPLRALYAQLDNFCTKKSTSLTGYENTHTSVHTNVPHTHHLQKCNYYQGKLTTVSWTTTPLYSMLKSHHIQPTSSLSSTMQKQQVKLTKAATRKLIWTRKCVIKIICATSWNEHLCRNTSQHTETETVRLIVTRTSYLISRVNWSSRLRSCGPPVTG